MNGGLTCTESMLYVFNEELALGLDDNALRMATGFSGGVGGRQHICGAFTGAGKHILCEKPMAVAVGAGGSLTKGAKTGDYAAITKTGKELVAAVKKAREEMKK